MISFKELKQRLFHPYYIIHFIYGSCYVVIRLIQLWKTQSINLQVKNKFQKRQRERENLIRCLGN